jgi:uncharacterized membrane protein YphA (DoxX/SURF4 family)
VVSVVWLGFALVARFCVGGLFTASALHQLADLRSFRTTVESYRILSPKAARLIAAPIAATELVIGIALVGGFQPHLIGAAAAALLMAFAAGIAVNLSRHRPIPCGCTGGPDELISMRHIFRNAGLIVLLIPLYLAPAQPWSVESFISTSTTSSQASWVDVAVASFVAAAIWLVWSMVTKVRAFPSTSDR